MPNKAYGLAYGPPQNFYQRDDPDVNDEFKELLVKYGDVAEDDVIEHVKSIRGKAWEVAKYPCIGSYFFLDLSITEHPLYSSILQRLRTAPEVRLLDLGSCFGQDLRKLAFDGVASSRLHAHDLHRDLLDLGYELFNDDGKFQAVLTAHDFFDPAGVPGLNEGSFDYVHAASFVHLFDWDEQVFVLTRALKLLKPAKGSLLFGRQVGAAKAKTITHVTARNGQVFRHDAESFGRLVREVEAKVGVKLKVDAECYRHASWAEDEHPDARLIRFAVSVL